VKRFSTVDERALTCDFRVFPGDETTLTGLMDVTVAGGFVESVLSTQPVTDLRDSTTMIEGNGRTLIPGVIDTHVHLALTSVIQAAALLADLDYIHLVAGVEAAAMHHPDEYAAGCGCGGRLRTRLDQAGRSLSEGRAGRETAWSSTRHSSSWRLCCSSRSSGSVVSALQTRARTGGDGWPTSLTLC
jgi:hypothetical protein